MKSGSELNKKAIRSEFERTDISLKNLADKYSINYQTIKSWKSREKWDKVATESKEVATKAEKLQPKKGAPSGNKNAVGNEGGAPLGNKNAVGHGAPLRNSNAVSHGLFRNFLPDDDETREIYDAAGSISPIDILWENIQLKFTAIIRAQKIMFVSDHNDMTKEIRKTKLIDQEGFAMDEKEWEIQFAWDKQATFLNAQSRAMSTLTSMIGKYEEMCRLGWADEQQKLRIEKLKLEVHKLANPDDGDADEELIQDWVGAVLGDGDGESEVDGDEEGDT